MMANCQLESVNISVLYVQTYRKKTVRLLAILCNYVDRATLPGNLAHLQFWLQSLSGAIAYNNHLTQHDYKLQSSFSHPIHYSQIAPINMLLITITQHF